MKYASCIAIAASALAIVSAVPGCPTPAKPSVVLTVNNLTSFTMTAFFASPSSSDTWGNSILSTPAAPNESRNFEEIPENTPYDFKAVFSNGSVAVTGNNVFTAGQTPAWDILDEDLQPGGGEGEGEGEGEGGTLNVSNGTSHAITSFFISPSSSNTWGNNVLTEAIEAGFGRALSNIPAGVSHDFRAIFDNGGEATTLNNTFSAGQTLTWNLTDADIQGGTDPNVKWTLYVRNETNCSIVDIRVNGPDSDYSEIEGGPNRLNASIAPGQTRALTQLTGGRWWFTAWDDCDPQNKFQIDGVHFGLDPNTAEPVTESSLWQFYSTEFGPSDTYGTCQNDPDCSNSDFTK